MKEYNIEKFRGIFPAFYACYGEDGQISERLVKTMAGYLLERGANGLYLNGSTGEFILLTVEERKLVTKWVMEEVGGQMTIIDHTAAASTADSVELARWAGECGVDAIASIAPLYYPAKPATIKRYWQEQIAAAGIPFIVYNIPNSGNMVSKDLWLEMLEDERFVGIKNTTQTLLDMRILKNMLGENRVLFNGPDELLLAGLMMGADSGIGSTYSALIDFYVAMYKLARADKWTQAQKIQTFISNLILELIPFDGTITASMKTLMGMQGIPSHGIRAPLAANSSADLAKLPAIHARIMAAREELLG